MNEVSGRNGEEDELTRLENLERKRFDPTENAFPLPMAEGAFYGLPGRIVKIIERQSEASREGILASVLVSFGNMIGRGPWIDQGSIHRINEFAVLVGETSKSRKGTSWDAVYPLVYMLDDLWSTRIRDGLQSGEAVIHAVRDTKWGLKPVSRRQTNEDETKKVVLDEGVEDKRLMIMEDEFGRFLSVSGREGNTLSATIRKAWDAKDVLYVEGKTSPAKATQAHISMIGHITRTELLKLMSVVENENGFSNRILWIAVKRSKHLALPESINWRQQKDILSDVQEVLDTFTVAKADPLAIGAGWSEPFRNELMQLSWGLEGKRAWCRFYDAISDEKKVLISPIVARNEGHVLRLAMLYAVLDASTVIRPEHLNAAIHFWEYNERSVRWIFGESTNNGPADKIYYALRREQGGMTRTQISQDVFKRNLSKTDLDIAFGVLQQAELATMKLERTPGGKKPTERWFAVPR
jgi:hypothetical protein